MYIQTVFYFEVRKRWHMPCVRM